MSRKNVLVIGANGYIGAAVCRAFTRAGYIVFGLVRRREAAATLAINETIPVIGDLADPRGLQETLLAHSQTFDVIVGCTEPADYETYIKHAITTIRGIAEVSNAHHVRPLVLWSSGCKDYGTTDVDGAPGLSPHTETSPLNAPALMSARATNSPKMFEQTDLFDAAVLRPTNVFGHSSSYFGTIFEFAATAAATGTQVLTLRNINPNSIMHALHVDDCAEAYLALAEHENRAAVAGQAYNISAAQYETAREALKAVAKEYGFSQGSNFEQGVKSTPTDESMALIFGFSQWVGSDKIRNLTGWRDRQMLFSENLGVYRRSYDAAAALKSEDVARIQARLESWGGEVF
ncbi:hypothetical protein LQW54_007561 [Pestalotiopsis sp. IQ-011]